MRVGSLCTGYGGLDMAVGGELAFVSDIDPHVNRLLDERFPGVPNIGDITDQPDAPQVEAITAGFPCQPVSTAGRRKGTDDERWIFDDILALAGRMDPLPVLYLENVPGLLSANGGDAMARVVEGLAALGYVGRYRLLRASDIGACHRRERWFCVAEHADSRGRGPVGFAGVGRSMVGRGDDPHASATAADSSADAAHPDDGLLKPESREMAGGEASRKRANSEVDKRPQDRGGKPSAHPGGSGTGVEGPHPSRSGRQPTRNSQPTLVRPGDGATDAEGARASLPTPSAWLGRRPSHSRIPTRPRYPGASIEVTDALATLLTPKATNNENRQSLDRYGPNLGMAIRDSWGDYSDAIARHAHTIGREPPAPTQDGRLNPAFVEWMMMLPAGWVTDLDLSRTAQLRILGNGVVPPQAGAAFASLLEMGVSA